MLLSFLALKIGGTKLLFCVFPESKKLFNHGLVS